MNAFASFATGNLTGFAGWVAPGAVEGSPKFLALPRLNGNVSVKACMNYLRVNGSKLPEASGTSPDSPHTRLSAHC